MDKKRKKNWYRHWFQAAFFALTNGYTNGYAKGKIYTGATKTLCVPGLNCYSCPGALGSCPIGSLQAVLDSQKFTVSCYVFGLLAAFGAFFGRLICGWMCPFGLVQDLLYKIPFVRKAKNLPGHKYLRFLRYVVLAVFVILLPSVVVNVAGMGKPWFCEYICPSGTLLGGIPLVALNKDLQAAIGWRFGWKVGLLIVTGLLSIVFFRPFCKYICPLGAIYGLFNPISFYRFRVDKEKCIGCKACQKACGMDIPVWEKPNSMDCIRCGDCKAACPEHAITSTWDSAATAFSSRCLRADPEKTTQDPKRSRIVTAVIFIAIAAVAYYYDVRELRTAIYDLVMIGATGMMGVPGQVVATVCWCLESAATVLAILAGIYGIYFAKYAEKGKVVAQIAFIVQILLLLGLVAMIPTVQIIDLVMLVGINIALFIISGILRVMDDPRPAYGKPKAGVNKK